VVELEGQMSYTEDSTTAAEIVGRLLSRLSEDRMNDKVNLAEKLSLFADRWSPRIVGELNGQHVKLAKLQGEFVWHRHVEEDELFLVLKGGLRILFRDGEVELAEGEFLIVPRGVEHKPVAEEETHVLLFEPVSTLNTGDTRSERTVESLEWL
jgi:mannose-6-phosphate isomerase-like protein (cupin superfamily)